MGKDKVRVSKKRQVKTYVELWHASNVMLEKARKDQDGSLHHIMASLTFTAFMLEAYLNHLGPKVLACWDELERQLSPLSKLSLIAEKLGFEMDKGRRPYQTVLEVFTLRNRLAHGKSEVLTVNDEICGINEKFAKLIFERLNTKWEDYCTLDNAERALRDTETVIKELHKHADISPDFPFSFGLQEASATLLPDA